VDGSHTGFYKVTAKRVGATAIVRVHNDSSVGSPTVQAGVSQNAALDVTYATEVNGSVWDYQWYFTPEGGGAEQAILGANASQYTVQSVDCTRKGTYRVQVNCGGGTAEASLHVNSFGLSSTTLEIVPNNIGSGTWSYTWYYSANDVSYLPIIPNPGTAYYTLPTGEAPPPGAYYKVEATRTGATARARMHHFSDLNPLLGTSVQIVATEFADLNVTFAAGTVGAGGTYHWYFTPNGGNEMDTGVTSPTYTISQVGCANQGSYRVTVTDPCGATANPSPSATLLKSGCP
jgi:hypothetical protein